MNTLVRNATSNLSRRADGYELLDQNDEKREEENLGGQFRTFSKKRAQSMVASLSYRRDRAKKRLIFLRSYQLSTLGNSSSSWEQTPKTQSRKLKKMVVKVKTVVVSVVSFMRIGSLKSCNCRSAISAVAPISIKKCS